MDIVPVFNEAKHFLGKLCVNGHEYQDTGMSLRFLRKGNPCFICNREYRQANAEKLKEKRRENYHANAEKKREYARKYYQANPEKPREYGKEHGRKYYQANAERLREKYRENYHANAEKLKEKYRENYHANAEKHRKYRLANAEYYREYRLANAEYYREYRLANAEKIRERDRKYRHANIEQIRKQKNLRNQRIASQSDATITDKFIVDLFNSTDICVYCGKTMTDKYKSLDHIKPLCKGGLHSVTNVLVCCVLCNSRKNENSIDVWLEKLTEPCRENTKKLLAEKYAVKVSYSEPVQLTLF